MSDEHGLAFEVGLLKGEIKGMNETLIRIEDKFDTIGTTCFENTVAVDEANKGLEIVRGKLKRHKEEEHKAQLGWKTQLFIALPVLDFLFKHGKRLGDALSVMLNGT